MNRHMKEVEDITNRAMNMAIELERNPYAIPVGISARHIHLSRTHLNILFGDSYQLTFVKKLSQKGQFAAAEMVEIIGRKSCLKNIRILGPEREETQIEIASSDARKLGCDAIVRSSGDLVGTPGILVKGPRGSIEIQQGVIVAERHVHMSPQDAKWFGIEDGKKIKVNVDGVKAGVMGNVAVRVNEAYKLDLHIDTDDANAFALTQGQKVTFIE